MIAKFNKQKNNGYIWFPRSVVNRFDTEQRPHVHKGKVNTL